MRKTLEKHDISILEHYLGSRRFHDGTQNFLKRKFDTLALKWRVTRVFLDCWHRKYGQGGALGLSTYARIGSNSEIW